MQANQQENTYFYQLRELYDAEHKIANLLRLIADIPVTNTLKEEFKSHHLQTQVHIHRLVRIAGLHETHLGNVTCDPVDTFHKEGTTLINRYSPSPLLDAALVALVLRVEKYEVTAYQSVRELAQKYSAPKADALLEQTELEEIQVVQKLEQTANTAFKQTIFESGENLMPYKNTDELPDNVRNVLPKHAQDIYKEAYNSASEQYKDPEDRRGDASLEETAHRVAWSAVKESYEKDETSGKWHKKRS
jgi:cation transport regulator